MPPNMLAHHFNQHRWGLWVLLAGVVFQPLFAAEPRTISIDPQAMGLDLPAGAIRPGAKTDLVTTNDAENRPVVGRVHAWIGRSAVILLPDGELVTRKAGEFDPTERPFKPVTCETLAKELTSGEFKGFRSRVTKHFVFIYNTSEEFAKATSTILETMLPGVTQYATAQKIDVHDPEMPLVVVMFATDEEFQKYRRMPEGVVAYYHTLSNRVFMYERGKLFEQRPDLAIGESISTIAHEGAHQILHNIGVQQRLSLWPMWLSEGLAEFYAPTSVGSRLRWKGAGQVNDLRMFELEQYVKSNSAKKPDGRMIEHTVLAGRLTSTGYATSWALTHYLARNRRAEFNAFVKSCSQIGPLQAWGELVPPGIVQENWTNFNAVFADPPADMELKLLGHLGKQPYTDPFKDYPHFVATLVAGDARRPVQRIGTFHSPALAQKWLTETTDGLPAEIRGSAKSQVKMFPNRAQAEAWAAQAGR